MRTYTVVVTVAVVSPEGQVLGTREEKNKIKFTKREVREMGGTDQDADSFILGELDTLALAAANGAAECIN